MTDHVFQIDCWFMNNDEDWDANFYYLIIVDGKIDFLGAGSPSHETSMRESHPDRIEHKCKLSTHRGHLECSAETDQLKIDHPEIWEILNKWCEFKDRRIKR